MGRQRTGHSGLGWNRPAIQFPNIHAGFGGFDPIMVSILEGAIIDKKCSKKDKLRYWRRKILSFSWFCIFLKGKILVSFYPHIFKNKINFK
jgi:hypothetical protein